MIRKIASKIILIIALILINISIVSVSSIACIKGCIPIQNAIINNESIIYGLNYGDLKMIPTNAIPLFCIALILIIISNFIYLKKRMINFILICVSITLIVQILITHNCIFFLLILNIYLFLFILSELTCKNKTIVATVLFSVLIFSLNIIQIVQHCKIEFNPNNIKEFSNNIIATSNNTLKIILLWIIPLLTSIINNLLNDKHISNTKR